MRSNDRREVALVHTEHRELLRHPALPANIIQTAFHRPVAFNISCAGHATGNKLVGADDVFASGKHLRFIFLHPQKPRQHMLLIGAGAGSFIKLVLVQQRRELFNLCHRARIVLLNGVAHRLPVMIEQHQRRNHAADTGGNNVFCHVRMRVRNLSDSSDGIGPPDLRVFLRPAGMRGNQIVVRLSLRCKRAAFRNQKRLDRGGSDINSKNIAFHVVPPNNLKTQNRS